MFRRVDFYKNIFTWLEFDMLETCMVRLYSTKCTHIFLVILIYHLIVRITCKVMSN